MESLDRPTAPLPCTPLPVVAEVSRVVTRIVDRITGDRADFPLLVAGACSHALKILGVESHILYGHAAWIEILEGEQVTWAGCLHDTPHFWVETEYSETVDLNASVAFRKKTKTTPAVRSVASPPMLWSNEVPGFYRFHAEGAAELAPTDGRDQRWWSLITAELDKVLTPVNSSLNHDPLVFPNEPMITSGRKLLDDSVGTFRDFDRVLADKGIPNPPF